MLAVIQRLLKLQRGEGGKVFQFTLLSAVLQAGMAIGMSAADALFLAKVGPDSLPYVYLITPGIMLVYIAVYAYLTSRIGIDRVFDLTLLLMVVGGVGFSLLLRVRHPAVYYVAKLYAGLWYVAIYTLFWNFTDAYFDIQDAKRLYPIFTGGGATGAMVGGSLVSLLTRTLPVEHLFPIWALLALAAFPVLVGLRRRWKKLELEEGEEIRGFVQETRETAGFIRTSQYVRLFIAVLVTGLALTTVLEFQYSTIFSRDRSAAQLASLFGSLYAGVNVFNLVINFFLFNRIVLAVGVGNIALVTPLIYLAAFLLLLFTNFSLGAAYFGFFAYQGILTSIEWNNTNFLFNAIPSEARKQVRTLVEGLAEPIATAAAGGFLLFVATARGYAWLTFRASGKEVHLWTEAGIATAALAVTALYVLLAVLLRTSYLRAMVVNLRREWLDFSRPEHAHPAPLDAEERTLLRERIRRGDGEMVATAVRLLRQHDPEEAFRALVSYLSAADEAGRLATEPLLAELLEVGEHEVLRMLLEWLDDQSGLPGAVVLQELASHDLIRPQDVAHLFGSPDAEERAAAAIAAWCSWDFGERLHAFRAVHALLEGEGPERAAAVHVLGRSRQERNAHTVARYLRDPEPRVRSEALAAVGRLVTRESRRLLPGIVAAIAAGDPEDRITGMEALGTIADPDGIAPLLAMGESFSPFERRQAEHVICRVGLKGVPVAVALVREARNPYPARSIAARALARLAFPQLEALSPGVIRTELPRAYHYLCCEHVLSAEVKRLTAHELRTDLPPPPAVSGLAVLSRYYRDMAAAAVEFVLELLTLGGRLPDFELISASLRSESRKERANALETVEQGVPRDVFKRLLPLIDGRALAEKIACYRTHVALRQRPLPEDPRALIAEALERGSPLEAAAAAQAIWECGESTAVETLRLRLRQPTADQQGAGATIPPLLRETILSLVTRVEGAHAFNRIERLGGLCRAEFFKSFTVHDLEAIARLTVPEEFALGQRVYCRGDRADALYLITEGTVAMGDSASSPVRSAREVFGEEALFGRLIREEEALSRGISVLRIPAAAMQAAARTSPRIAVGLLAEKMRWNDAA